MKNKVIIIGGGVSGITTALTLQLLGLETTCIAEHFVNDNAPSDPRFASLYPAASIIPHFVKSNNLDALFPAALAIFEGLYQQRIKSLELHRHYELFEFPVDEPAYTAFLQNYSTIEKSDRSTIPHRKNAPDLHGWSFGCFVTEWPLYMQQLYDFYSAAGGALKQMKIVRDQITDLPADIIINCTGIWSNQLFDDTADRQAIRGHLVHIPGKEPLFDSTSQLCSYNYTPVSSVYAAPDGSPSDVYFYPVNGKWILGGSRQPGILDKEGQWQGKTHEDTIDVNGQDVPRQIVELNNNILKNTFNKVFDSHRSQMNACMGYRFSRGNTKNGLQIISTEEHGKKVIHNYGHGGAGVTLSWGCALMVLNLIHQEDGTQKFVKKDLSLPILKRLQIDLQNVYLEYIHQ